MKRSKRPLRSAHFLLIPELLYSPPNDAIIKAWISHGVEVHVFSPGQLPAQTHYGPSVITHHADYSIRWLIKNLFSPFWMRIGCFSGTSEDPLAVVGVLAFIFRRPSFLLVDEIKAGSYRGDSSDLWKGLCQWAMRRARFNIVSDTFRIQLLREYAKLQPDAVIKVYPGCYFDPPRPDPDIRRSLRARWNLPQESLVIAASGGFNLTAGADWLIRSLKEINTLYAVIQPLGVSPLALFLLKQLEFEGRLFLQEERLSWDEAWQSAVAFDIGMAIYTNPAPQFQKMGISSNRLCMFIAMGVPVICSTQESFGFVEQYDCGVLVSTYADFAAAIAHIASHLDQMRENCRRALRDYVMPSERYPSLRREMAGLLGAPPAPRIRPAESGQ